MKNYVSNLLCLILAVACRQSLSAQCPGAAREVVKKYFDYDFAGYRLSSEGHSAIWDLTEDNGEPPEMPVLVTKGHRIINERTLPDGLCSFEIQFTVYRTITEGDQGLQFKASTVPIESKQIEAGCTSGTCRINIEFGYFKVSPHPGKKAVEEWLNQLEKIQKTVEETERISALKKQVSSLY